MNFSFQKTIFPIFCRICSNYYYFGCSASSLPHLGPRGDPLFEKKVDHGLVLIFRVSESQEPSSYAHTNIHTVYFIYIY